MLAPVGAAYKKERINPMQKFKTDSTAEQMITPRKLFTIRIEVKAGKIIKLEISMAPIILIPKAIVTAVNTAMTIR